MRRRGRIPAILAGAVLLGAAPAGASQSEPAAPSGATVSGVTVEAAKPANPLVDPTTQFVRQHLAMSRFEQYARFRDPVCVRVIGLPEAFDAFVARRVVEVAREVKAPVADMAICTPNVDVVFSPRPQAQLADIAKRRDILFGFYWKATAKQVATFSRPIQAWYLTRAVGTDGQDILELNDGPSCVGSGAPGSFPCDVKTPPLKGRAGSRLGADMSSELVHSLIIADANKVAGERIDAVADYIAVLALAKWQGMERCNATPTILNLMAEGCAERAPEAATPEDLALLKGLYLVDPREGGQQQRATIASQMRAAQRKDREPH